MNVFMLIQSLNFIAYCSIGIFKMYMSALNLKHA